MLSKFKVSNFKSFERDFVFDLTETNGYSFNNECTKNGIVNNALIYGHNGVGKSNLALGIFDIIEHLVDRNTNVSEYAVYLNAYSKSKTADFYYEFRINDRTVIYEYKKTSYEIIVYESFSIDGEQLAFLNREVSNQAIINFKGAETLKTEITNSELSLLKYIKNNSELDKTPVNEIFFKFFDFVEGMLFFRSLSNNIYLGLEVGIKNVIEDIVQKDKVRDFEKFLNRVDIECKLAVIKQLDKETLAFDFNGTYLPFAQIASQGTKAFALFYFWFTRIIENKVSFLFIDEFDAFYHHDLSATIVEELKKTGVQFILTTHNTSIITNDLLRPDCYFLMNKKMIRSLSKSTSKELRQAHNIEKMYKAGSFDVE